MSTELENLWCDIQGLLSKEMKGPSFQTWIKPSKLIEVNDSVAIIAVKNDFNKNFLKQNYIEKISSAVERRIKKKIIVEIVVKEDLNIGEFVSSIAMLEPKKLQEEAITNKETNKEKQGYFDRVNLNFCAKSGSFSINE